MVQVEISGVASSMRISDCEQLHPFFLQIKNQQQKVRFSSQLLFFFSHYTSVFVFSFGLCTSNQFSELSILFSEGPNEDKKCSVYIILQICLLLLSPFTINKFQRKILKVSRYLGSDLIKIQCFLCLIKQDSVSPFLFPHSGFCVI